MADDENIIDEELDELMEDIEIEDELHHEEKVRKKNAKVLLISIVGLLAIAVVYFGINYYTVFDEEAQLLKQAEPPQADQSGIETLPLQDDIKKIEKKESPLPQEEVKKKDENKTLPQKEDIEKKESTTLERIKKEKAKETIPPQKIAKKIKKVDVAKKQIKEKESKSLSLPTKDFKKPFVEKKLKPPAPSPQKAAKKLIPVTDKTGKHYIQLGLFVVKENADNLIRSLKNKGFSPSNSLVKDSVNMYRVYAGKFSGLKMAREGILDLKNAGINTTLQTVTDGLYTIQTGSFYIKENAEKLKDEISELGLIARIVRVPLVMDVHKVYIGFFKTKRDAAFYQQKLAVKGFSQALILNK